MSTSSADLRGASESGEGRTNALLLTIALSLAIVIASFFVLQATATMSLPLLVSVMLAVLFAPTMRWLEARKVPSSVGALGVLLILFTATASLFALVYVAGAQIAARWPFYVARATSLVERVRAFAREQLGSELPRLSLSESNGQLQRIVAQSLRGFDSMLSLASAAIFVVLFLGFILIAREQLRDKLVHVVASVRGEAEEETAELLAALAKQVRVYLYLKVIISVCTGIAFGGVAAITGLDFPIVWAFTGFVLNFIPSLGPILASIPPIFIAFFQFESPAYALLVSLLMAATQFVSGNIVEPLLLGDRLRLNFIVVLVSISTFGLMWGFAGMLIAVPTTAGLTLMLRHSRRYRMVAELLSS